MDAPQAKANKNGNVVKKTSWDTPAGARSGPSSERCTKSTPSLVHLAYQPCKEEEEASCHRAINFTVAIVLTVLQCYPMISWIYVSASLRLHVPREKIRDALKIELIGCASKRVRLSRILEIFDLLASRLEPIE